MKGGAVDPLARGRGSRRPGPTCQRPAPKRKGEGSSWAGEVAHWASWTGLCAPHMLVVLQIIRVMELLGCYKSYPHKENLVPRFRKIREQMREFFLKLIFSFPSSLIL
jgi:hypothetical protein